MCMVIIRETKHIIISGKKKKELKMNKDGPF